MVPQSGWVKANTNAAWGPITHMARLGCLAFDEDMLVPEGVACSVIDCQEASQAEVVTTYLSLEFARDMAFSHVIIEFDCYFVLSKFQFVRSICLILIILCLWLDFDALLFFLGG